MIIIEILPDCIGEPIRFACRFGNTFANTTGVIISNDDPIGDATRYFLHVSCGKAHMDAVSHFVSLHYGLDGEASSETLAEYVDSFGVECEGCALTGLPIEELLIPLCIDELASYYFAVPPHSNH
jgi:hypothetical protein